MKLRRHEGSVMPQVPHAMRRKNADRTTITSQKVIRIACGPSDAFIMGLTAPPVVPLTGRRRAGSRRSSPCHCSIRLATWSTPTSGPLLCRQLTSNTRAHRHPTPLTYRIGLVGPRRGVTERGTIPPCASLEETHYIPPRCRSHG